MKDATNNFLHWLKGSFENRTDGASARKLAAFAIIVCVVTAHISWLKYAFIHEDFTLLSSILTIDYGFIATCLALTTYQQVKKNDAEPKNS